MFFFRQYAGIFGLGIFRGAGCGWVGEEREREGGGERERERGGERERERLAWTRTSFWVLGWGIVWTLQKHRLILGFRLYVLISSGSHQQQG